MFIAPPGFTKGAPDRPTGELSAITKNNLVAAEPHGAAPGWDWARSPHAYPAVTTDRTKRSAHGCAHALCDGPFFI